MGYEARKGRAIRVERGIYAISPRFRPRRGRFGHMGGLPPIVDPTIRDDPDPTWPESGDADAAAAADAAAVTSELGGAEAGVEVGDDVVDRLETDRQPHEPRRHARAELLVGR